MNALKKFVKEAGPPTLLGTLIGGLLVALVLIPTQCSESSNGAVPESRISGEDRYGTAVAISEFRFSAGADHVYLATADERTYADALTGVPLDGPVLLVPSCDGIPEGVASEVQRLDPDTITALGGEDAICEETLEAARALLEEEQE